MILVNDKLMSDTSYMWAASLVTFEQTLTIGCCPMAPSSQDHKIRSMYLTCERPIQLDILTPKLSSASLEFQPRSSMDEKLPSYQLMGTPSSSTEQPLRTFATFSLAASIFALACVTVYSTHYALLQSHPGGAYT